MSRAVMQQALDALVKLSEQSDCDIDPFTFSRYGGSSSIEALRAELAKPEWIPVSERLPDDCGPRLVYLVQRAAPGIRHISQTHLNSAKTGFYVEYDEDGEFPLEDATHWQPLPLPPA